MSKANFKTADPDQGQNTQARGPEYGARLNAVARQARGRALEAYESKDLDTAAEFARRSQILHPDEPLLTYFDARVAFARDRFETARKAFRRTVQLRPDHPGAWRYLGIQQFIDLESALAKASWRRAALLEPDNMASVRNLFQVERQVGLWEDAERAGIRSTVIQPTDDQAAFELGMLYLSVGRWAEGWPLYDRRIWLSGAKPRPDRFDLPMWDGVSDGSLDLLVWADQNVGDEMQFAQLLPEVIDRVGTVTLECDARLVPVFRRSFPSITVVERSDPPSACGPFDAQIPQGHLGRILRSSVQNFTRGPDRWLACDGAMSSRLRSRYRSWSDGRPVIGIAWKSANRVFNGKNMPLEEWTPILRVPGAHFLSVQYGEVTEDLGAMRDLSGVEVLHDPNIDALHDMDTFAAQLDAVDLVISISNSTIHQACGLGRPVWGLLHLRPDWRWGVEGTTCPWFPSLTLYRQSVRFEWGPVANAVAMDLAEWVAGQQSA